MDTELRVAQQTVRHVGVGTEALDRTLRRIRLRPIPAQDISVVAAAAGEVPVLAAVDQVGLPQDLL